MGFDEFTTVSAPSEIVEKWEEERQDMNCSKVEYIRMLMNAGRNELGYTGHETGDGDGDAGEFLEDRIVEAVIEMDAPEGDELIEAVKDGLEADIREQLNELQSDGKVDYDAIEGGMVYVG